MTMRLDEGRSLLQALADTTVYFHHTYHEGDLMHCQVARCKANHELLINAAASPPIQAEHYFWGKIGGRGTVDTYTWGNHSAVR